jgi:hypothetical protein
MIDSQLAAFLQEGLAIHIGTRNAALEPNGARAVALRVDDDGIHVVVYVAKAAVKRLMSDLESNGQAAVTFVRPVDERATQLKGTFVSVRPAKANERALVMEQWEGFLRSLQAIGIPRTNLTKWTTWPAVAIRLRTTRGIAESGKPARGAIARAWRARRRTLCRKRGALPLPRGR